MRKYLVSLGWLLKSYFLFAEQQILPSLEKHNRAKSYEFFSQKGEGIKAYQDIILIGEQINVAYSILIAGQDVRLHHLNDTGGF